MQTLNDLTSPQLVDGFNSMTGSNVKKFETKGKGIARIEKYMAEHKIDVADFLSMFSDPDDVADLPEVVVDDELTEVVLPDAKFPAPVAEDVAPVAADTGKIDDVDPLGLKKKPAKVKGMPRPGSKKAKVLDAALQEDGVTDYELKVITGWPSAKGTMYRTLKAAGYGYESFKREETGETAWRAVKAAA